MKLKYERHAVLTITRREIFDLFLGIRPERREYYIPRFRELLATEKWDTEVDRVVFKEGDLDDICLDNRVCLKFPTPDLHQGE